MIVSCSFLRANSEATGASQPRDMDIPGQLMAQYLMALLGGATLGSPRGSPFFGPFPGSGETGNAGRWGDYVFTQEGVLSSAFFHSRRSID